MDQSGNGDRRCGLWKICSFGRSGYFAHGGRFIARGARIVQLEDKGRLRNVIAKSATQEAAEACYRSADYQAALEYAKAASERDLMIVETSE